MFDNRCCSHPSGLTSSVSVENGLLDCHSFFFPLIFLCWAVGVCTTFPTCKPLNVLLNTESETSGYNQNTDLVTVPGHISPQLQVLDVVVNPLMPNGHLSVRAEIPFKKPNGHTYGRTWRVEVMRNFVHACIEI